MFLETFELVVHKLDMLDEIRYEEYLLSEEGRNDEEVKAHIENMYTYLKISKMHMNAYKNTMSRIRYSVIW